MSLLNYFHRSNSNQDESQSSEQEPTYSSISASSLGVTQNELHNIIVFIYDDENDGKTRAKYTEKEKTQTYMDVQVLSDSLRGPPMGVYESRIPREN